MTSWNGFVVDFGSGHPAARYKNVTTWARVHVMSGENVVSEVPAVILFSYAHTEALNLNMQSYRAYYDEINVYNPDEKIYPKAAHQSRNRNMVDRSDLVVFYVKHEYGGTWQTMKYAVNQKKKIINLVVK